MITRVRQRPLALAGRGFIGPLPHLERLRAHVVLDPDLLQAFACGVLVVLRGLGGQRQRPLPNGFYGLDDFGGQPRERGRIALGANPQIPPEPLQARRNRGG